jgi:HSP20 family protein
MRKDIQVSITRWKRFDHSSALQEHVNRLLKDSLPSAWTPAVDIYETENELVLQADLPEVSEKDLDIQIENNLLTIRGERRLAPSVKEENFLRVERTYGSFSRSFRLPTSIDSERIEARYKNGVLTIELPKRAESKPKQVKINISATSN